MTLNLDILILCMLYVHSHANCNYEYACSNQSHSGTSFSCDGYRSCKRANSIFTSNYISCNGGQSCQETKTLGSDRLFCGGSKSCYDIQDTFSSVSTTYCRGLHSCSNNKYTDISGSLFCQAGESCIKSHFTTKNEIDTYIFGGGAYSLKHSIIEAISSSTQTIIAIELIGYYAGFNLTINCTGQALCNVNCQSNGCLSTFIVINTNSNRDNYNISCNNYGFNNNTINYCPQFLNYSTNNSDSVQNSLSISSSSDIDPFFHDFESVMTRLDDDCNDGTKSVKCDDNLACEGLDLLENNQSLNHICCRGEWSCNYVTTINLLSSSTTGHLVCSAVEGCSDSYDINIYNDGNVYCLADSSCLFSEIYFRNSSSYRVNNNNSNTVYCSGYGSCSSLDIFDATSIYCTASGDSCQKTKFWNVSNVHYMGGVESTLTATTESEIHSGGVGVMVIHYLAYNSGYLVDIYCDGYNDTCYIDCGLNINNRGCMNTSIYCSNDDDAETEAKCFVVCDADNVDETCPRAALGSYTIISQLPSQFTGGAKDSAVVTPTMTQFTNIQLPTTYSNHSIGNDRENNNGFDIGLNAGTIIGACGVLSICFCAIVVFYCFRMRQNQEGKSRYNNYTCKKKKKQRDNANRGGETDTHAQMKKEPQTNNRHGEFDNVKAHFHVHTHDTDMDVNNNYKAYNQYDSPQAELELEIENDHENENESESENGNTGLLIADIKLPTIVQQISNQSSDGMTPGGDSNVNYNNGNNNRYEGRSNLEQPGLPQVPPAPVNPKKNKIKRIIKRTRGFSGEKSGRKATNRKETFTSTKDTDQSSSDLYGSGNGSEGVTNTPYATTDFGDAVENNNEKNKNKNKNTKKNKNNRKSKVKKKGFGVKIAIFEKGNTKNKQNNPSGAIGSQSPTVDNGNNNSKNNNYKYGDYIATAGKSKGKGKPKAKVTGGGSKAQASKNTKGAQATAGLENIALAMAVKESNSRAKKTGNNMTPSGNNNNYNHNNTQRGAPKWPPNKAGTAGGPSVQSGTRRPVNPVGIKATQGGEFLNRYDNNLVDVQ